MCLTAICKAAIVNLRVLLWLDKSDGFGSKALLIQYLSTHMFHCTRELYKLFRAAKGWWLARQEADFCTITVVLHRQWGSHIQRRLQRQKMHVKRRKIEVQVMHTYKVLYATQPMPVCECTSQLSPIYSVLTDFHENHITNSMTCTCIYATL